MKHISNKIPKLTLLIIAFLCLAVYIFWPDVVMVNLPKHQSSPAEKIDPEERVAADLILLGARQEVKNMIRGRAEEKIAGDLYYYARRAGSVTMYDKGTFG